MKIKLGLFYLFILISIKVAAQTPIENKNIPDIFEVFSRPSVNKGKINIIQDEQIKDLINRYIENRHKDGKITGYRIRIFSDSGNSARQKAMNESTRFSSLYSDMPAPVIEMKLLILKFI